MSTVTVTKYAQTVTNAVSNGWASILVAQLNADDGVYAYTNSGQMVSQATASNFGFALPTDATLVELTVEGEYMCRTYSTLTLAPQNFAGSDCATPAIGPPTGDTEWHVIQGVGTLESSTRPLPGIAYLNDSAFGVLCAATGPYITATPVRLDYVKLIAKYAYLATVTTDAVTDVTADTATCGGETTDDGTGTISACGVCWGLSPNPTKADFYTTDDSGIGTFVSSLTGLWASCTYYVRAWATTEDGTVYGNEVSFATLANAGRSLVARPFTTRAAAAESVARTGGSLIDWWIEGDVAHAELRPTGSATVPRDRWYVVSRDTPGAVVSLVLDAEDTPDIICVVFRAYAVANVRDGTYLRAYWPAAPTSAIERVQLVDLSGQFMGVADAEDYAANVLLRVAANVMSATITAIGGLATVDGLFRPAPLIRAGDWIDVVDLPGHAPAYITGSTYSRAENVVTITTGSQEQRDLIIPGMSALPTAMALSVFGADTSYSTTPEPYSEPADDPYTEPGPTDPGYVPEAPYVEPATPTDEELAAAHFKYYTDEWFL